MNQNWFISSHTSLISTLKQSLDNKYQVRTYITYNIYQILRSAIVWKKNWVLTDSDISFLLEEK